MEHCGLCDRLQISKAAKRQGIGNNSLFLLYQIGQVIFSPLLCDKVKEKYGRAKRISDESPRRGKDVSLNNAPRHKRSRRFRPFAWLHPCKEISSSSLRSVKWMSLRCTCNTPSLAKSISVRMALAVVILEKAARSSRVICTMRRPSRE